MNRQYEVWKDPADDSVMLATPNNVRRDRSKGLLSPDAELLYKIEAATYEEACAIHYLRMGWAPYSPSGEAASCPKCAAIFYPDSSGECWRCDYTRFNTNERFE